MIIAEVAGFPSLLGPIDVTVRSGDRILIAGPNGSGKTSLLRCLAGLPSALEPRAVTRNTRAALTPQHARDGLIGLTVEGEFRMRQTTTPSHLVTLRRRDTANLSTGETRQTAIGVADAATAPLLLLDEATEGLDEAGRRRLAAIVANHDGAVVMAEHLPGCAPTRVIHLAPAAAPADPVVLPPAGDHVVLRADRAAIARGATRISLPPVAVPSGLHVVTGGNGCGKTTLLLRLAGLLSGSGVAVDGDAPKAGTTVRMAGSHAGDAFTKATVADEIVGCDDRLVGPHLLDRHPLSLSGGEAQRVALSACLGRAAPVYLLDEPEAHLDADGRRLLFEWLGERVGSGACIVAASHDSAVEAMAHSRIEMGAQ